VGALIGAQRESAARDRPGLRDFLLVALTGGLCAVLENAWLAAAALLSIAGIFIVFHFEEQEKRAGITTELAAGAAFVLALLAGSPQIPFGQPVAIGLAILIALFLEAKQRLQRLLRETIVESEFNATLAFVTVSLVIYPLLPTGLYGPYRFFSPRQVWMFVILVSSISYVGYFFEKFLGAEKGLVYTGLLGGLASTTAVTLHLGRISRERREELPDQVRGFLIANSVQFPRALLIVLLADRQLALACAWPLALMTAAGVAMAEAANWIRRRATRDPVKPHGLEHANPFRIVPALRFGALFTLIVFVTRVATARAGPGAFFGTSLLGGLIDVATVIAPAADLLHAQDISLRVAEIAVLLALASNGALKIILAVLSGTRRFAGWIVLAYLIWAGAGALGFWL